jgi:hypothetical protein
MYTHSTLVTNMGGTIGFSNNAPCGTVMTVTLPAATLHRLESATAIATATTAAATGTAAAAASSRTVASTAVAQGDLPLHECSGGELSSLSVFDQSADQSAEHSADHSAERSARSLSQLELLLPSPADLSTLLQHKRVLVSHLAHKRMSHLSST